MSKIKTISPVDGSVYFETPLHSQQQVEQAVKIGNSAFLQWSNIDFDTRKKLVTDFVNIIGAEKDEIATELSWQMGRPITQSPGEITGFMQRAQHMIDIAQQSLAPHIPHKINGFERWIDRVPLGLVTVLSPWNYPFLTSVNAIVPALMAGNTIILKHSAQTPLVAQRYLDAAKKANLPLGVFQILHIDHSTAAKLIADDSIAGVFFTGSVNGGRMVQKSLTNKFIPCGLELGGKDPAYVRADANVEYAVENLVDGSFFNSGQSCCGVERIYVDSSVYDDFVEQFVHHAKQYKLGNPFDDGVNLGPMVKSSAADYVRTQIANAISQGAKSLVDEAIFPASKSGTPYLSPHVIVDVNHDMELMINESFGPVVGIMKVNSDAQAIQLMNDSQYGLTASIWSEDLLAAKKILPKIQTGTAFLNRCDYLDPALAWTGVKNTGRGITLSSLGYEHVTRAKSYNLRLSTQ